MRLTDLSYNLENNKNVISINNSNNSNKNKNNITKYN